MSVSMPQWLRLESRYGLSLLAIYLLRTLAGVVLFIVTMIPPESVAPLIAGPGVWHLLPDTLVYDAFARDRAVAAAHGVPLGGSDGFALVAGAVYSWVAPTPLVLIVLNPVIDVVTLLVIVRLTRALTGQQMPLWFLWVLGTWPSWVIWSTQLMKDSLLLCVTVSAVAGIVRLMDTPTDQSRLYVRWIGIAGLVVLLVVTIAMLRTAVVDVLVAALLLTVVLAILGAIRRRARWSLVTVIVTIFALVFVTQTFITEQVLPALRYSLSPGYLALGAALEQDGNASGAIAAYRSVPGDDFALHREALSRIAAIEGVPREPDVNTSSVGSPGYAPSAQSSSPIAEYFSRVGPRGLLGVRRAHDAGASRISEETDITDATALTGALFTGLAHVLFAPFPWEVLGSSEQGTLRYAAFVEWPWLYVLLSAGIVGSCRLVRAGQLPAIFVVAFIAIGLAALAIAVPNFGLLFRYRLPFLVLLAATIPAAFPTRSAT